MDKKRWLEENVEGFKAYNERVANTPWIPDPNCWFVVPPVSEWPRLDGYPDSPAWDGEEDSDPKCTK